MWIKTCVPSSDSRFSHDKKTLGICNFKNSSWVPQTMFKLVPKRQNPSNQSETSTEAVCRLKPVWVWNSLKLLRSFNVQLLSVWIRIYDYHPKRVAEVFILYGKSFETWGMLYWTPLCGRPVHRWAPARTATPLHHAQRCNWRHERNCQPRRICTAPFCTFQPGFLAQIRNWQVENCQHCDLVCKSEKPQPARRSF